MRKTLKINVSPVNLLAYAYAGSNPALPTMFMIHERCASKEALRQLEQFAAAIHGHFSGHPHPHRFWLKAGALAAPPHRTESSAP